GPTGSQRRFRKDRHGSRSMGNVHGLARAAQFQRGVMEWWSIAGWRSPSAMLKVAAKPPKIGVILFPPMRRKAVATSAGLSILFLVVYGGCSWITSQRHDVGTFYFDW